MIEYFLLLTGLKKIVNMRIRYEHLDVIYPMAVWFWNNAEELDE
jgi:hypothetical protein